MATSKKDTSLNLRIPQDLITAARRKARQQDRPLSQVVRELLRTWLSEQSAPVQAVK